MIDQAPTAIMADVYVEKYYEDVETYFKEEEPDDLPRPDCRLTHPVASGRLELPKGYSHRGSKRMYSRKADFKRGRHWDRKVR